MQVSGQAWGSLEQRLKGTDVVCGTSSRDSDSNFTLLKHRDLFSHTHSLITECLLEVKDESIETERSAWGSGRWKS